MIGTPSGFPLWIMPNISKKVMDVHQILVLISKNLKGCEEWIRHFPRALTFRLACTPFYWIPERYDYVVAHGKAINLPSLHPFLPSLFSTPSLSTSRAETARTTAAPRRRPRPPRRSGFQWTPLLMDLISWVSLFKHICGRSPRFIAFAFGESWFCLLGVLHLLRCVDWDLNDDICTILGYPLTNISSFLLLKAELTSKLLRLSQYLVVVTFVYFRLFCFLRRAYFRVAKVRLTNILLLLKPPLPTKFYQLFQ